MTNFAPRLGLVWNPHGDGKQTLRVGAALLYDATETWFNERETTNPPIGTSVDVASTGTLTNPWLAYPGGNPFPTNGNLLFPKFGTYVNMPLNPRAHLRTQWNVTYQRQFAGSWVASVSYLGNETTHLWIAEERNPSEFLGTWCLYYRRRELHDLLQYSQFQSTASALPGEPRDGRLLRQHQHHGRWRGLPL